MHEDRIVELETRLAYQEQLLETLNGVITEQQQQIERLIAGYQQLMDRIPSQDAVHRGSLIDDIPPHY